MVQIYKLFATDASCQWLLKPETGHGSMHFDPALNYRDPH